MRCGLPICGVLLCAFGTRGQTVTANDILKRVAAEADRFADAAPRWIATETLRQTADTGESHAIVSEYGFVLSAAGIREVRRIISVDGKRDKDSKKVDSLALALASDNDAERRKMLEAFEKHRLRGVATDFGPLLALFARGNMQKFEFSGRTRVAVSSQTFDVFRFQQLDGSEALTIFEGGKPVKQRLRGEIWVRSVDGVPWRVALDAAHEDGGIPVRDVCAVDYAPGRAGILLPATVVHKQFRNGMLHVQDTFTYAEYREVGDTPKP